MLAVRMHTKRLCMDAAYQFYNYSSILVCEYIFPIDEDTNYLRVLVKDFTLSSIYRSNQPLWKIRHCIN